MKNNLKLQPQRLPSAERKKGDKAVSVLKCFICTQMFYSQVSFDDHMSLHSSKISRNVPEQIQRKTMESFRAKKNVGAVGESSKDAKKDNMSVTVYGNKLKTSVANGAKMRMETAETKESGQILAKIQQKQTHLIKGQSNDNDNEHEMGEMQEALRESTILVQKIQYLISEQNIPQGTQTPLLVSPTEAAYCSPVETQTQQQFLHKFLIQRELSIVGILSTTFSNCYLKGHQDQLLYLQQVSQQIKKQQLQNKKIAKIQSSILASLKQYLDNLAENNSKQCQITTKQQSGKMEGKIVQNVGLSYCNECFLEIGFQQSCYEFESNKYHCECWEEMENGQK